MSLVVYRILFWVNLLMMVFSAIKGNFWNCLGWAICCAVYDTLIGRVKRATTK